MGDPGERRNRLAWSVGVAVVLAAITVNVVLAVTRVVTPLLSSERSPTPTGAPGAGPSSLAGSPTSEPSASTDLRLPDVGADVLVVQADAAVFRIELATGAVVRTQTPELTQFSSLVAGPGWVVSKTVDNDTGVVVRDGEPAQPLPAGLRPTGRLYPAGGDALWLVPEEASGGYRTATKVGLDGRRVGTATIRVPDEFGVPDGDRDGELLVVNAGGAYRAGPDGLHRLGAGQLLAVGAHHVLTWDCDDRARCNAYRLDRSTGRRTLLGADRQAMLDVYPADLNDASDFQGVLSPDGTHAAIGGPAQPANDRPLVVIDLRTGRVDPLPGSLADTNPNAQVGWTSNGRWLLALTDGQLRAYDTSDATVRTFDVGEESLQHLVVAGGAGF